jgi:hypothetical protein
LNLDSGLFVVVETLLALFDMSKGSPLKRQYNFFKISRRQLNCSTIWQQHCKPFQGGTWKKKEISCGHRITAVSLW